MEVVNDNSCSWVNDLSPRNNIKILQIMRYFAIIKYVCI